MKIALAHPAPTPFAQQVGRALFEAGMLSEFYTTVVDRPDSAGLNILNALAKSLDIDLAKQFSRRSVTEFPLSLVKSNPWYEIPRLLVAKFDRDQRLTDRVFHWGLHAYDRWVAQQALVDVKAIYAYETNCLATFQAAKHHHIACIYDVPALEHDFVESLIMKEQEKFPEIDTPYRRYCRNRQAERTQSRRQEWHLADVVIANSELTKASYAAAGLDVEKVRVVPFGFPPVHPNTLVDSSSPQTPIRFMWAGNFSILKGAHYLLQAWQQLQPAAPIHLDVYGAVGLPANLLQGIPSTITLSGTVPRSELYIRYRQADVLVFPTLCDGFGMVVTEAFSQGLPVITTDRAGASRLIQHGVNGLIIPAGDAEALAEAMEWCITHRAELHRMRQAALDTAARWQWADYRGALIDNIVDGLTKAGF